MGIGGKAQNDDEVDRQKLSSNIQLKRQLLGPNFEKKQSIDRNGGQDALTSGLAVKRKNSLQQPPQNIEPESEDENGRSSLGKRKWKTPLRAQISKMEKDEIHEKDEERSLNEVGKSDHHVSSPQAAITTNAEIAPMQETKKSRKRKRNKRRRDGQKTLSLGQEP